MQYIGGNQRWIAESNDQTPISSKVISFMTAIAVFAGICIFAIGGAVFIGMQVIGIDAEQMFGMISSSEEWMNFFQSMIPK